MQRNPSSQVTPACFPKVIQNCFISRYFCCTNNTPCQGFISCDHSSQLWLLAYSLGSTVKHSRTHQFHLTLQGRGMEFTLQPLLVPVCTKLQPLQPLQVEIQVPIQRPEERVFHTLNGQCLLKFQGHLSNSRPHLLSWQLWSTIKGQKPEETQPHLHKHPSEHKSQMPARSFRSVTTSSSKRSKALARPTCPTAPHLVSENVKRW